MPIINKDGTIGFYEWESFEPREYLGLRRDNPPVNRFAQDPTLWVQNARWFDSEEETLP